MPDSVIKIYGSWYRVAETLPDNERLAFYDAIMRYGFNGDVTEFSLGTVSWATFEQVKPLIDSYHEQIANGKRGGRTRK